MYVRLVVHLLCLYGRHAACRLHHIHIIACLCHAAVLLHDLKSSDCSICFVQQLSNITSFTSPSCHMLLYHHASFAPSCIPFHMLCPMHRHQFKGSAPGVAFRAFAIQCHSPQTVMQLISLFVHMFSHAFLWVGAASYCHSVTVTVTVTVSVKPSRQFMSQLLSLWVGCGKLCCGVAFYMDGNSVGVRWRLIVDCGSMQSLFEQLRDLQGYAACCACFVTQ
jgi:hypothetical protein